MIRPMFLKKGSKVGILSPAGIVKLTEIEPAVNILQDWGFDVVKGKYLYEQYNFFAGTDEQRTEDFQNMLDNPEIRAIFCSRGGYGIIRIIDKLSFKEFLKSPKWIVGYSDITIFHTFLNNQLKCESIHGIMPKNFQKSKDDGSLNSLKLALFGENISYIVESNQLNTPGKAKGKLAGGNLSIIYSLQGTEYEINTRNKILFIEDIHEDIYHIDRMMMNLKISGKLSNLKGLIVGGMNKIKDTDPGYGKSAYEVISGIIAEYDFPVIYGFNAGHFSPNLAMFMGRNIEIEVTGKTVSVDFRR